MIVGFVDLGGEMSIDKWAQFADALSDKSNTKHVVYAYPDAGYESDQERARQHLVLGDVYDVERVEAHSWHTNIYLKDFSEIPFNSVLFSSLD